MGGSLAVFGPADRPAGSSLKTEYDTTFSLNYVASGSERRNCNPRLACIGRRGEDLQGRTRDTRHPGGKTRQFSTLWFVTPVTIRLETTYPNDLTKKNFFAEDKVQADQPDNYAEERREDSAACRVRGDPQQITTWEACL